MSIVDRLVDPPRTCGEEVNSPEQMHGRPVVSVLMLAYNHEKYIAQAIESVLAQETHFPYELIIGDDHSTDETLRIALDMQKNAPGIIRIVHHQENVGMHQNLAGLICAARGKYIAFCEADDYWRDPCKLNLQFACLEANPEAVITFGDSIVVRETIETNETKLKPVQRRNFSSFELAIGPLLPTQTVMFRNLLENADLTDDFYRVLNLDRFLFSLLSRFGGATYLGSIRPCAYRIHDAGIWSQKGILERRMHNRQTLLAMRNLHSNNREIARAIDERILKNLWDSMVLAIQLRSWRVGARCLVSWIPATVRVLSNRLIGVPVQ